MSQPNPPKDTKTRKPSMLKRALLAFGAALLLLVSVLLVRTFTVSSKQLNPPAPQLPKVDGDALAQRLAAATRLKTISNEDPSKVDREPFMALHKLIQDSYPKVHQSLQREVVAEMSLLYTWPGTNKDAAPIVLMGHMDVVPIERGTEKDWVHPPFDGVIKDGYIWGRGSMDDKAGVLGILEAVELLLGEDFKPKQTIYLAFGHDEEVGGEGAKAMAALLKKRGIKAAMVLVEGLVITDGIIPGLKPPGALIGLSEKGYLSVELTVELEGGHSSMPPKNTAVGILSHAIAQLDAPPLPARLAGPVKALFATLGPEMPFGMRLAFSNLWLLSPVVLSQLEAKTSTNATIRTTTAPTMFQGSVKDNVLPASAKAVVNFRILPGDTMKSVLEHVKNTVNDPRVQIKGLTGLGGDPSPVSSTTSAAYNHLATTIRQIYPDAVVSPALCIGATDSRHFREVAVDTYRFLPQRMTPEDRPRFHGTNERLSVKDHTDAVLFYRQLILNFSQN